MKTAFKKSLALVLATVMLLCALPFTASAATYSGTCGDNLTWSLDTDTGVLNITGTGAMTNWSSSSAVPWYSYYRYIKTVNIGNSVTIIGESAFRDCNSLTSVTIPDSVKTIGSYAFLNCISLISVTIPDSVTTIGDYLFAYCDSLTSVTIPDSVTTIGDCAFCCCYSLTSITIPNSVTTIGSYAFDACRSLTSITVNENNKIYSSDSYGVLFNKNKTTLIQYPIGNTRTSYTIPDSVIIIGEGAFDYCYGLRSITIPDSVTTIGENAFRGCTSLTSATIPDGVTSIGDYAFYECTSLTSVTIPDSVTAIGDWTFAFCDSLNDVYYSGTQEHWKHISIGPYNEDLISATIHYNHISSPDDDDTGDSGDDEGNTPDVDTPDRPPVTSESGTFVGVLEDYETTVIINGNSSWISKVCIDGRWFDLYREHPYQETIKSYEDKQVVAVVYDGYVSSINLISNLKTNPKIYNFNSLPTLEYYDGVFRKYDGSREDKWHTVNGVITNPLEDASIDVSKIPVSESRVLKNVSVTIKSSDKKIISLDKGFWDIESDTVTIELGDLEAGGIINLSEKVLNLKTGWEFPADKKEHSVKLYYTVTGTLNGETITREYTETINLINKDYGTGSSGVSAPTSYKKQSIKALFKEMQSKVMQCDVLNSNERLLVHSIIASHIIAIDLVDSKGQMDAAEEIYEIACYISGIKGVTYKTAGKYVIDAIEEELDTTEDELKKALKELLGDLRESEEFNTFVQWYYDQMNTKNNVNKRSDIRCPVDVYVYDENGKLVLSIVSNQITEILGDIHAFVCDDDKIVYLPTDMEYEVKIIATGNGTMDYIITEYNDDNKLRKTVYEDIPLTVNETYNGTVTKHTMPDEESYNLTSSDGTEHVFDKVEYETPFADIQLAIKQPTVTTINYGETLVLQLEDIELPEVWKVEWSIIGNAVTMSASDDGKECRVTSTASGNVTVRATVVDENGEPVLNAEGGEIFTDINIKSNASFWQKIVSFFKNLFRMNRIIY